MVRVAPAADNCAVEQAVSTAFAPPAHRTLPLASSLLRLENTPALFLSRRVSPCEVSNHQNGDPLTGVCDGAACPTPTDGPRSTEQAISRAVVPSQMKLMFVFELKIGLTWHAAEKPVGMATVNAVVFGA